MALNDDRKGDIADFERRSRVTHLGIIGPSDSPTWLRALQDRSSASLATFWNGLEASEKRKDARLAREIHMALPVELTPEEMEDLVMGWIDSEITHLGMICQVDLHGIGTRNPHVHILIADRPVAEHGWARKKDRSWQSDELISRWREQWALHVNHALDEAGHDARVSHLSLAARGETRVPLAVGRQVWERAQREGWTPEQLEEAAELIAESKPRRPHADTWTGTADAFDLPPGFDISRWIPGDFGALPDASRVDDPDAMGGIDPADMEAVERDQAAHHSDPDQVGRWWGGGNQAFGAGPVDATGSRPDPEREEEGRAAGGLTPEGVPAGRPVSETPQPLGLRSEREQPLGLSDSTAGGDASCEMGLDGGMGWPKPASGPAPDRPEAWDPSSRQPDRDSAGGTGVEGEPSLADLGRIRGGRLHPAPTPEEDQVAAAEALATRAEDLLGRAEAIRVRFERSIPPAGQGLGTALPEVQPRATILPPPPGFTPNTAQRLEDAQQRAWGAFEALGRLWGTLSGLLDRGRAQKPGLLKQQPQRGINR